MGGGWMTLDEAAASSDSTSGSLCALPQVRARKVNWSEMSFTEQLRLLRDTDLYISGVGTALMNQVNQVSAHPVQPADPLLTVV